MSFRVIIPARLGSSRLPNKPLKDIEGKTLIQRVVDQAKKSNAKSVHVATDSNQIIDHCSQIGADAILTKVDHHTGTDRLSESCEILKFKSDELIINVQGDEPFIDPRDIDNLAVLADSRAANMVTLYTDLIKDEVVDRNVVKLWIKCQDKVEDFSRNATHLEPSMAKKHLGIYGYRVNFLHTFVQWKQSKNEIDRNLEQMRAMDNGEDIFAIKSSGQHHLGVDTESDLQRAIEIAKKLS